MSSLHFVLAVFLPCFVFSCCPPKQWEGREYVAMGSKDADGKTHYTEIDQLVSVDSTARMVYVDQSMEVDGNPVKQHVLQDFKTATQYVMRDGNCVKMGVQSMEPGCLADNATVLSNSYMGAGNSKIMTTVYHLQYDRTNSYATVATDGCIPMVFESSGMDQNGGSFQMTVEFFNITAGISNPAVFTIPAVCNVMSPMFTGVGVGRR